MSSHLQTDTPTISDRVFVARTALILLIVGVFGYFALAAFNVIDVVSIAFLVMAELLALVLGWAGRSRLPGKIAVGGVLVLMAWSIVVYLMFRLSD